LPKGEAACLAAIAQHPEGADREQLTVLTGYKRSSRDTYLQRLREKGMIQPGGVEFLATAAGFAALGADFTPLPTGSALRGHWMGRLPEGERRVLEHLVAAHPDGVARDELDEATGYKRSSRDTYLQRLGSRRLVVSEPGSRVRASDMLFD
jgi:DNA-binding IclR family transcriptional regulator